MVSTEVAPLEQGVPAAPAVSVQSDVVPPESVRLPSEIPPATCSMALSFALGAAPMPILLLEVSAINKAVPAAFWTWKAVAELLAERNVVSPATNSDDPK